MEVGHLSDDALLLAATSAVHEDAPFAFFINKKLPQTNSNFLEWAKNYINHEALTSKKSGAAKISRGNPEEDRRKRRKACGDPCRWKTTVL